MPIYVFVCSKPECKATFELLLKDYDEAIYARCPECGGSFPGVQPSAPNFTVKGYNAKNGYSK